MPHFFIDPRTIKDGRALISGADAKHIFSVLRLKASDWLVLSDGKGTSYRGEIVSISKKEVKILVTAIKQATPPVNRIRLCQALVKHDKFEWIIQKAVELGCQDIIPFTSERTVPTYRSEKLERWQKIAREAAKQCGTSFIPKISSSVSFKELIENIVKDKSEALLFFEGEEKSPLSKIVICEQGPLNLIIGPEGGFAKEEIATAKKAGIKMAGLGPLILRVETAAIAGISLVQYRLGYFENNNATVNHSS